jgi:hypothetical protein
MNKQILFIIMMAIGITSCNKDLNLAPPTNISAPNFFQNKAQFQQALVGAYSNLRLVALTGIYMDEMRSDNTFFTYYPPDRGTQTSVEAMAQFLDNNISSQEPNNPGNRYGNDYSGIARCNTILSRIKGASGLTQGAVDSISGQALFLRAFYYYDLVTHYGGVPLQLDEVSGPDAAFIPRNTDVEVYTQIITDLTTAVSKLPVATVFPQSGAASRGSAEMLLAYCYMQKPTKEYAKAEAALLDITKMNYGLLTNYSDVFALTNKNSKESIFEVQYKIGNDGQQSDFTWRFIPKSTNTELILGLHGTSIRGGLSSGGWNVPTQEMVDSYEKTDLRLPASIQIAEGTMSGDNFTATAVKSPVGYVPTAGLTYYYFVNKYRHPPYIVEYNTDDNWPVFRYSGALLLLAECLVSENKASDALPYLNQVRRRAGLADLAVASAANIANEMRHEVAFENHRWTDLIRYGTAVDVLNAKGVRMKALYGWILPAAFNVTATKLIYAIPTREVQTNTKLTQNPGY